MNLHCVWVSYGGFKSANLLAHEFFESRPLIDLSYKTSAGMFGFDREFVHGSSKSFTKGTSTVGFSSPNTL